MAIATTNQKLAVMEWGQVWEPGLPLSPGTLDQRDQQQLLWGYPWGSDLPPSPSALTVTGRYQPAVDVVGEYED